jgi:hypothetical protein
MIICDVCRQPGRRTLVADLTLPPATLSVMSTRDLCERHFALALLDGAVQLLGYDGARRLLEDLDERYRPIPAH